MSTKTIAHNSVWLGVEALIDFTAAAVTSVAIARGLGPGKLGYYVYIFWLTRMSVVLGNVGIPAMAVKYMAEYCGRNEPGVARTLYQHALRMQLLLAAGITIVGAVLVWVFASLDYRWPSLFLVLSIFPAMLTTIPTIANIAIERPDKNVVGSFASSLSYVAAVVASLMFGWGLPGIALGVLVSRSLEFIIRFVPVMARMRLIAPLPLPSSLREKMFRFSSQSLVIMVLGVVVWDRSEILFLKTFCVDVRQVAFYSVAFSLADQALTIVRIFGNSIATTIRAQYGRDKSRLLAMMATTAKYLAVISFPIYLGMAAIAGPAIRVVYGPAYASAIPVLVVTALLAIPKAFQVPIQALLQSAERQGFLMRWSLLSAALNLLLDWILIPRYGAIGAAYGNGLAQAFAILGFWIGAVRLLRFKLPLTAMGRTLVAGAAMACVVLAVASVFPSLPGIMIGVPAGIIVYLALVRMLGSLDDEDRQRFLQLRAGIPRALHNSLDRLINLLIRRRRPRAGILDGVSESC